MGRAQQLRGARVQRHLYRPHRGPGLWAEAGRLDQNGDHAMNARSALLCALLLALCSAGASLRAGEESVGTTSANFMKIPYSARPAGMGEAFTAISDDESAFEYNPAGAAQMLQGQLD